jgi:flagellin-like protein
MTTKGITPVIAIILLLLITIAVIGFATGFFQSLVDTTSQQTTDATDTVTGNIQKTVSIEATSANSITIKNSGLIAIADGDLTFLVAGADVTGTCTGITYPLSPGQAATCGGITCTADAEVKISAPGNSPTKTCPPAP